MYHIGVDCGLFVEMNYMINAMLYCLSQRIRFQLYSDDANFGTGIGWTEYFLPFCEEVHETFHKKYNFHRLPSWRRILKVCRQQKSLGPLVWKLKSFPKTMMGRLMAFWVYKAYVQFAQDVSDPEQYYRIPELGINISVDLLLHSRSFVGSITTGPSVFIMKLREDDPFVQAVDCPKTDLASSLSLTIDVRAAISKRFLSHKVAII